MNKNTLCSFFKEIFMIFKQKEDCVKELLDSKQKTLNPSSLDKKDKSYKTVEDIACRLQKNDAQNIAVTGPYGSGKSSILISLRENYPQYKYLNISLATLKSYKKEKSEQNNTEKENDNEELNRLIEYSILQQLIYREKQEVIPNSRFKRIFHIGKAKTYAIAFAAIAFFIAFIVVFEPNIFYIAWISDLFSAAWLNIVADILGIIYMISILFFVAVFFIRSFSKFRLNKLNLKNGEIEITENTSIFNKHLDEILYFFQVTNYNAVVIEDLDRFDSPDIFLKLRELNVLLNESQVVGRSIVFIYAVKDDIFLDSERSKFFDYITTVIPVINPSNSKDKLKEELELRGYNDICDFHLKEIAFFINDMRLLKNIANEYHQYREKIEENLLPQNLLAMIVYKNYYPRSFAELHRCEGKIYQCFQLKKILVEKLSRGINDKIEKAKYNKDLILQNKHLKEKELRQIYIDEYRRRKDNCVNLEIDEIPYSFDKIVDDENIFNILISKKSVLYHYYCYHYGNSYIYRGGPIDVEFSDIEKKVDSMHSYMQRLNALRENFDVEPLEQEISDIHSLSFSDLLNQTDLESCSEYQSLKMEPMEEFFLLKGYINENYYDYISYFYGKTMSHHDWNFVLSLKLKKQLSVDYHIDNVENCINEIPDYVYKTKSILNIGILSYLTSNYEKNKRKCIRLINTAVNTEAWDFLIKYYQSGYVADDVFSYMFRLRADLWNTFVDTKDEYRDVLIEIWMRYAELAHKTKESINWLESRYSFLTDRLEIFNIHHIKEIIFSGKHQFSDLNASSGELIDYIVENDFYEINSHNISTIVNYFLCRDSVVFCGVNMTDVYNTGNKSIIARIENNIELCLKEVFISPSSKNESKESIRRILESDDINETLKYSYLNDQSNSIELELLTTKEAKILAIKLYIIIPDWDSVYHYCKLMGSVTDELVCFIEKFADELVMSHFSTDDISQELFIRLIVENVLSLEFYKKILPAFEKFKLIDTDFSALSSDKVWLLLTCCMLQYSDHNTKMLAEYFEVTLLARYLIQYKDMYLKETEKINYTKELAEILMASELLAKQEKGMIAPCFDPSIFSENVQLSNDVLLLKKDDIDLSYELLISILENSNQLNHKIFMINRTILERNSGKEEITELLNTLPEPYRIIAMRGKKPTLPHSADVERLVETLDKIDYISSYSINEKGIRVNTKK